MKHIDSNTLWHYLVGDTSPDQTLLVKKHLANCKDCMREFELLSQIESTLYKVDEDTPSFGFSEAVTLKVENEMTSKRKHIFSAKFLPYMILCGFVLAILSTIIASIGLDIDLSYAESVLNTETALLILIICSLLWGFYFIDKICKKFFNPMHYDQSY
ncbi:zf-HC2 domain-containing protein [Psychroserpens luteolus]|uniref:zf-HC2 domain-containing protein n=1 Tax=Psychroserpens luteolus TaxID=2855840 RepID=UPI001E505F56|nr:zf-HC2 domain-containing protein [Psychroserpens luteolus]MCD2259858.1 zf-HC2 domain-containing protein [Psychroserpens luteolus]